MPTNLTFDRTKQRALPIWLVILTALLIIARVVSIKGFQHVHRTHGLVAKQRRW